MTDLAADIKQHNQAVQRFSEDRVRYRSVCAACGKDALAPHGVRRRTLRYVVGNAVWCVVIWLARWRCRECGRSMTDYPHFRPAL